MHTPDKTTWQSSFANELGRLANGLPHSNIVGTNTIEFVPLEDIPKSKTITYGRLVVDIQPQKQETHRTRLTVGGNMIHYDNNTSTPTADLVTIKVLLNSVISTKHANFMTIDITNFYLNTNLPTEEYMKLPTKIIPPSIWEAYNLNAMASKEHVYMKIKKGVYGLPQAGILAYQDLQQHLAPYGFNPSRHTPGLWAHVSKPITFTLVVDDFGIKYIHQQDVQYLIDALQTKYTITCQWKGDLYCGLQLQWDYHQGTVNISMPTYIQELLHQHNHSPPDKPVHSPSLFTYPKLKQSIQLTAPLSIAFQSPECSKVPLYSKSHP